MIYTKLTKEAMKLCFEKHKNQIDKSGMPYVFHPFHLAESMKDEYTTCVALLHDTIEDTDMTADELMADGFPKEVVEAVTLLTHSKSEPYLDYVKRVKVNNIARYVKIADLMHNADLSRLDTITPKDLERVAKYQEALKILRS